MGRIYVSFYVPIVRLSLRYVTYCKWSVCSLLGQCLLHSCHFPRYRFTFLIHYIRVATCFPLFFKVSISHSYTLSRHYNWIIIFHAFALCYEREEKKKYTIPIPMKQLAGHLSPPIKTRKTMYKSREISLFSHR